MIFVLSGASAWALSSQRQNLHVGLTAEEGTAADLRKYFNSQIKNLKKQLSQISDQKSKMEKLKSGLKEIQTYRDQREMADASDEIYMNIVVHSLEELPSAGGFNQKDCGEYRRQILFNYEPTADRTPEDPAVSQALDLLKVVCS